MVRPIPWTALALLLAARVAIAQTGTLVGRVANALTGAPKYPTLRDSYGTMHCFIVPLSEKSSNPNY